MNMMSYKGYPARVEYDAEDEILAGRIAGINDMVGFHASDVACLKRAFEDAVDDYVATCERAGKPAEKPYSGRVMFRVDPEVHAKAALAADLAGKSLNQWAEEALREAATRGAPASRAAPFVRTATSQRRDAGPRIE